MHLHQNRLTRLGGDIPLEPRRQLMRQHHGRETLAGARTEAPEHLWGIILA